MKQNQTELNQEFNQIPEHEAEPFAVYRDGQLDQDWAAEQKRAERIQRMKHVGTAIVSSFQAAGREIGQAVGKVMEELDAEAYDSRHGTDYAKQLRQKRRDERNAQFATRLGLM